MQSVAQIIAASAAAPAKTAGTPTVGRRRRTRIRSGLDALGATATLPAAMQASIVNGAPETAAVLAQDALTAGFEPLDAINLGFVPGMHAVGEQFAQHTLFLPDMMASAEAMRAAMQVLEPELRKRGGERPNAGTVVLGTTKGDIHEIGKTLVGTLLTANGFCVCDLGVDVSAHDRHDHHARPEECH